MDSVDGRGDLVGNIAHRRREGQAADDRVDKVVQVRAGSAVDLPAGHSHHVRCAVSRPTRERGCSALATHVFGHGPLRDRVALVVVLPEPQLGDRVGKVLAKVDRHLDALRACEFAVHRAGNETARS